MIIPSNDQKATIEELEKALTLRALAATAQNVLEDEIWSDFCKLRAKLKAARGDDRSERARRISAIITALEVGTLSAFKTLIFDGLGD